ncbi:heterogeneous nuclear ribonucleoprotein u-like protein 1 [Nannochloropsis oceanica]
MDLDIKKLKVDQLREELGKRGLDTKGKKDELQERLQNAIDKEMLDAIDEEDEVGVPPPPAPTSTSPPPPSPAPVPVLPSTSVSKLTAASAKPAAHSLTRMAHAVPAAPVVPPAPVAPAPAAGEGIVKKGAETAETDEEKKRRRAERFGIPISEEEKKKARAERFGLVTPAAGNPASGGHGRAGGAGKAVLPAKAASKAGPLEGIPVLDAEEEVRRRARAARFGIPDPKLEEEKKAERAKRFADPAKAEEEAKKKARMERFAGTPSA